MGGVGQAGPGLARVVVKLHQAEYQVRLHQLKCVRWIGYDVSGGRGERKRSTNQDDILKIPMVILSFLVTIAGRFQWIKHILNRFSYRFVHWFCGFR